MVLRRRTRHGPGTHWCARCYRPSHPRPCSSYPDQGTLDWHLPTLPIWGRGSLVPFRIWPGVLIPAHDLLQRRRRVLFLSGRPSVPGHPWRRRVRSLPEVWAQALLPRLVVSGICRNNQPERSRRNSTAATGRRTLGQVGVPRKEKTGLKAKVETSRTHCGLVISPPRARLVGTFCSLTPSLAFGTLASAAQVHSRLDHA